MIEECELERYPGRVAWHRVEAPARPLPSDPATREEFLVPATHAIEDLVDEMRRQLELFEEER